MPPQTSTIQKIGLFFWGIVVTLVLLEIFLQAAGGLFLFLQETANRRSLSKDGYRILCIGESTTALGGEAAYPRQLEKILNSSQTKVKFSVINKGIPATTTKHILSHIDEYLKDYKPQMVVAMMGINDVLDPFYEKRRVKIEEPSFWERFKTYKLYLLVKKHLVHAPEVKSEVDKKAEETLAQLEAQAAKANSSVEYTRLALLYRSLNMADKEKATILKALDISPNNLEAVGMLGHYYKRMGNYEAAVSVYKRMIPMSEGRENYIFQAYENLAESYKLNGQIDTAIEVNEEVLRKYPQHSQSYEGLGDIYLERQDFAKAVEVFEKQIAIDPKAALSYGKLAHSLRQLGRKEASWIVLTQGIERNPSEPKLYGELSYLLLELREWEKALDFLRKGLGVHAEYFKNAHLTEDSPLLRDYEAGQRQVIIAKWNQLLPAPVPYFLSETKDNFLKLRNALNKRGIPLVAVQYPMRPVKPLKEIFANDASILFVDNQSGFQEAVGRKGYDVIFTDRFANDFGHCTPAGNEILATNVAKVILKSVLKK